MVRISAINNNNNNNNNNAKGFRHFRMSNVWVAVILSALMVCWVVNLPTVAANQTLVIFDDEMGGGLPVPSAPAPTTANATTDENGSETQEQQLEEESGHSSTSATTATEEVGQSGEEGADHDPAESESSKNDEDGEGELDTEGHNADFAEVGEQGVHEEEEAAFAVLFPSFTMTLGLIVFIILTRFWAALPYTAVMFLLGTLMGLGVELLPDAQDHVSATTRMWTSIDAEVLLLVFLPGLIFKDAYGLNVHLFRVGASQCLIFAFPMVLVGTILTACVPRYIFDYHWSWNLSMTFGSILSATDPVAVAALLEQVGAPPRLKLHIAGEALLNDGSAIVFFTIFALRYFNELGIEGVGEDIGWGRGFELFFRMSLGGAAIGFITGCCIILILYLLDRRFSREENVVEVTATCALAYLGYYVADFVCRTSGVIATVIAGVTVKFLGRAMLNDAKLLEDFWVLLEHMLNTVLFTLGGAVWGTVISNGEEHGQFSGKDWGYLIVLYIMLTLIRFLLFFLVYPLTVRIGLSTNWKETVFQVYGGLRGAVGIALAIALDSSVRREAPDSAFAEQTNKAFGLIGGMAFLTLVINGTTAGPLLIYLGLADSTSTRKKIVEAYRARFQAHMISQFVTLLTEHRFRNVNFALVKDHVPYLAGLTKAQLVEAVERHKDTTASDEYCPPYLQGVLPYLKDEPEDGVSPSGTTLRRSESTEKLLLQLVADSQKAERTKRAQSRAKRRRKRSSIVHLMAGEPLSAQEMRTLFISLLRAMYEKMIDRGELVDSEFLAVALDQSLEFAADNVSNGGILQDWQYVTVIDGSASGLMNRIKNHPHITKVLGFMLGNRSRDEIKYEVKRMKIERSMCFMAAHKAAQKFVEREFVGNESELSEAAKIVISESQDQWAHAEAVLRSYKPQDVQVVTSHKFCAILLNSGVHYVTKLVGTGLLKDDEAEHWVKEIEEHLEHVLACRADSHPGELTIEQIDDENQKDMDRVLPPEVAAETQQYPNKQDLEESLKLIQDHFKNSKSVQNLFQEGTEENKAS